MWLVWTKYKQSCAFLFLIPESDLVQPQEILSTSYTKRVSGHELVSVSETCNNCSPITSLLKSPEPTSLAVQPVEDGTAHQPVNIVQHHSKTQANSLSTPMGLFLVLSSEPGGDRATVKGAGGNKNRPHVGAQRAISPRQTTTHFRISCCAEGAGAAYCQTACHSQPAFPYRSRNLRGLMQRTWPTGRAVATLPVTEVRRGCWMGRLIWCIDIPWGKKVKPSLHDIIAYSPFAVAAVKFWPQLTICL